MNPLPLIDAEWYREAIRVNQLRIDRGYREIAEASSMIERFLTKLAELESSKGNVVK